MVFEKQVTFFFTDKVFFIAECARHEKQRDKSPFDSKITEHKYYMISYILVDLNKSCSQPEFQFKTRSSLQTLKMLYVTIITVIIYRGYA